MKLTIYLLHFDAYMQRQIKIDIFYLLSTPITKHCNDANRQLILISFFKQIQIVRFNRHFVSNRNIYNQQNIL